MMIEVIDRIPTYPGRVKMTPVEGQENTYDMVRADVPIESGTPINRALFESYRNKVNAVVQSFDNKLFELSQRVQVGNLTDGSVFGLYENGVLVPYIKIAGSYSERSGSLVFKYAFVLRLDVVAMMKTRETSGSPEYIGGDIDRWLTEEFFGTLDAATQNVIPDTSIQVAGVSGSVATAVRKVFILSNGEYGFGNISGIVPLGSSVPYFNAADRRISRYLGEPTRYYTRSSGNSAGAACVMSTDGSTVERVSETTIAGVRPAFLLPPEFEVTTAVPNTANVVATAEVIE